MIESYDTPSQKIVQTTTTWWKAYAWPIVLSFVGIVILVITLFVIRRRRAVT